MTVRLKNLKFNVCIVRPDNFVGWMAFQELAELLYFSIREIGYDV